MYVHLLVQYINPQSCRGSVFGLAGNFTGKHFFSTTTTPRLGHLRSSVQFHANNGASTVGLDPSEGHHLCARHRRKQVRMHTLPPATANIINLIYSLWNNRC